MVEGARPPTSPEQRRARRAKEGADEARWDYAIDVLLNSGTLYPYMDDFFKYVDGEISEDEFHERMPS